MVHVWGNACNFEKLIKICKERNILIIEDAAESLGTTYTSGDFKGKHTGTIGTIGCISFNGNKIISTGGGGMIITDDHNIANEAKYLTTQAKDDPVKYIHNEVGYNFRLGNIQAAIGVAQLEKLPEFLKRKRETGLDSSHKPCTKFGSRSRHRSRQEQDRPHGYDHRGCDPRPTSQRLPWERLSAVKPHVPPTRRVAQG